MPAFLALPIGIAFPTLAGWLLLRLAEGKKPVLFAAERWVAGFIIGCVLTTYVVFLTEITGIGSFSFVSMLVTQLVLLGALGTLYFRAKDKLGKNPKLKLKEKWKPWQKAAAIVLGVWLLVKILSVSVLLASPAYYDDAISNWNMRGKAFFVEEELVLSINPQIGSYPQSVPLLKTWLAHLHGGWSEPLVNAPHILWYLSILVLFFFALKRVVSTKWSLFGTYILGSVPLYLLHGGSPYADGFLSALIFLAVTWLFTGGTALRLGAIAAGLLVFTKNEAMLLHLPTIAVLFAGTLAFGGMKAKEKTSAFLWYGVSVAAVLVPWVLFKWANDLGFGNAKDVSGLEFAWQEGVSQAIFVNTFFEGNWGLLPVVFLGILAASLRTAFTSRISIPVLFCLIVLLGQLPIYMFTSLSVEAINQTGYARGIIHLIPLLVFVTVLLGREKVDESLSR